MFADIEFNREGVNYKAVTSDGEERIVRPDIIIHNRRSGGEKMNFLVVECKKASQSKEALEDDGKKILALMQDGRYEYSFGLQVVYGKNSVQGTLFFKKGADIESEDLSSNEQRPGGAGAGD
ncbi:MAG TPA: hypothetical protein VFB82_08835 [Blastocatellia bacterium]|nr:hypothetical protein [Blastocatellia bacterium]